MATTGTGAEQGFFMRLVSVVFGMGMVVVLELWYLGRQLTSSTATRMAKRKYTTLPEGMEMPARRLSRTTSSLLTSGGSGGEGSRSSSTTGLRRTLSRSSLPLGSAGSSTYATVASSASAATGGDGAQMSPRVMNRSLSAQAALAQGYSSTSTSTGFGNDSLLVTKLAVLIVIVGALVYFPFWLNILAALAFSLAKYLGNQKKKAAAAAEDDVIAIREIPSSSKGSSRALPGSGLISFFSPLRPENSMTPEERRAALVARMKPILKQAADQFTSELAIVAKVNPNKFKNSDVPPDAHWLFINNENGVLVFKNSTSPRQHLNFLCKVAVAQSAATVYECLKDPMEWKPLDPLLESVAVVDHLDPKTQLLRLVYRGGEKCVKEHARDFCTLFFPSKEAEGKYRVLLRSILVSKPLPTPDLLRGEILVSGFFIEQTNANNCIVTLLTQVDPKQAFPHSVYTVASSNQHILLKNLQTKFTTTA